MSYKEISINDISELRDIVNNMDGEFRLDVSFESED